MSRRAALISLIATLAIAWGSLAWTQAAGVTPLLGLDLQGGFSVVLEAPEDVDEDVLERAVQIMRRRIEALGNVQEPEIAVLGANQIEVQLPGVTDRERALSAVGRTGQLEFRPVLEVSPVLGLSPVFTASDAFQGQVESETDTPVFDFSGETPETVPPEELEDPAQETTTSTTEATPTTEATNGDETTTTSVVGDTTTTSLDLRSGVVLPDGLSWCDEVDEPGCVDPVTGLTPDPVSDQDAFLASEGGVMYHVGSAEIIGSDLEGAQAQFQGTGGVSPVGGSVTGQWVVVLDFNSEGSEAFAATTARLAGFNINDVRRQFAIVLDGTVQSAPAVANDVSPIEGITGGSAIITLGASGDQQEAAQELSIVLRYGSLPVTLEQASVQSVSATLGADSLQAGLIAGIGGLALVALAMIAYYRALGLVNIVGLSVFGSLVIVVYSLLGRWQGVTLTLAGVAGVIVSIGITSDSYIVYFERIKEEVHKGRSMRSAIDHAFQRSFRTILTADTVSFFGAVLLFFLAVGSVKGFALALGIATVLDVLVAVFFTKPAVSLVARTRFGEGGRLSIRGATGSPAEVEA